MLTCGLKSGDLSKLTVGAEVLQEVDPDYRLKCARTHSAAHLVCTALDRLNEASDAGRMCFWYSEKANCFPGEQPNLCFMLWNKPDDGAQHPAANPDTGAPRTGDASKLENKEALAKSMKAWETQIKASKDGAILCKELEETVNSLIHECEKDDKPGVEMKISEFGVRWLDFMGSQTPCGGTHVDDVRKIGTVRVSKAALKKGVLRVHYGVEEVEKDLA